MDDYRLAHASGDDLRQLLESCHHQLAGAEGHTLGFLYVTSPLARAFGAIVEDLGRATGIKDWAGTVGYGICATGTEYFERPAIVAMTCRFAPSGYRVLGPVQAAGEIAMTAGAGAANALVGVAHGDPRNPKLMETVAGLAERHGTYLVGGLSSAEQLFPQVAGSELSEGGVSGVLLTDSSRQISVGLTQGCSPIGPAHEVTEVQDQIIVSLDGRPAFEVLREDCGAAEDGDPRRWLINMHAAIPVPGSDKADYVVRNLAGIDPERGLIAIAEQLSEGDRVMFVRRDRASAERDLDRMLADMKKRARTPPKAGLYFSCLARGPNLFASKAHEMKAIERAFGPIPIAGFYGNGEIANDRVYGYTGVLTLFS